MKLMKIICAAALSALACSLPAMAQDKGYWRASSNTAQSVTGDIALSADKLIINFLGFNIVHARDLQPGEVTSVFDADSSAGPKGTLYKLDIPAAKKFLHKNTLCSGEDTQWMVTYAQGNSLQVALFSGQKPPTFTLDAIKNSTDLCGTFSYNR